MIEQLLRLTNKSNYSILYSYEEDSFTRKTINSKIQGKRNILIICQSQSFLFGFYTPSIIPHDDDHWKKKENDELQSFAFIKENDTIKSFHSRSKESCLYMNINDDDDSILLAVRHFFFIKSNGSYISQKCESFFGCHCDQSLIYPNTFTIDSLLILELSD